ncbi:MAG: DUF1444 family protein [Planctomycetes bacterium]|nr:DUF1444 family protein [Planctomycetota bacterium]
MPADTHGMVWLWVGWAVAALVAVVWFRRLLQPLQPYPPEVAAFLLRFETELALRHPGVLFLGMLGEGFGCLLRVDGQEVPVGLAAAFRRAEAFPSAFPAMVDSLVAEVRERGLDRVDDCEFAAAAPRLLPQVRSRQWLEQRGCFGDSGLVHRPLHRDLVVVYALDDGQSMVFVCRAHLQRWRRTVDDVHNLALANLAARSDARQLQVPADQPVLLRSGDGYDAARALLLAPPQEGLLVAVPDRDTLWFSTAAGQDLATLMATTEDLAQQAAHPVSPQLWRVTNGGFEAVSAPQ